jgi:hypothetical protein
MAKIQIKQIEYQSDGLPKQHEDPIFNGTIKEKVEDTIKNKAIYYLLRHGQYKKYWLPDDKEVSYPDKDSEEFKKFIVEAREVLKDSITFNQTKLDVKDNGEFVRIAAVCVFNSSDMAFNLINESYPDFLSDKKVAFAVEPSPSAQSLSDSNPKKLYRVNLLDASSFLGLRAAPGQQPITSLDSFKPGPPPVSSLSKTHSVQTSDLGGAIGILPNGTEVELLLAGLGASGQWDQVKVLSVPGGSDSSLVGKVGYVDPDGLEQLNTQATAGQKTVQEILAETPEGVPQGAVSEEQLELLKLVDQALHPPLIETETPESTRATPSIQNTSLRADWTRREPLTVFKSSEDERYEITVKLPVDFEGDRREEARKVGLKTLLKHFNRRADEAYVIKLLTAGSGEISQVKNYWSDDNVNNRTIYYLVVTPYLGAGGFNYKKHEQAEVMTIEEMVTSRIIDFQYTFTTNTVEQKIKDLIDVLKNKIKRGLDNYNGVVENAPDIDYEINKLELFIPSLKEIFAENNITWRTDKEDQVELGLDSDLKIVYVRYGPQDGKDGNWRLK